MMPITQHEEWRWQQIALQALAEITAKHRTLPVLEWRLAASMRLYADLSCASDDPMGVYEAWCDALGLDEAKTIRGTVTDTHLRMGEWITGPGHHVRVTLLVKVPLPEVSGAIGEVR